MHDATIGAAHPARDARRPEYARLARDFTRLARVCGLEVDRQTRADVAMFAAAIEWVDRVMDAMPLADERTRFGRRALAALTAPMSDAPERMHEALDGLREILLRRRVVAPFARLCREELDVGEAMRKAEDAHTFLTCVAREGALTVEMTLLATGLHEEPRFAPFLRATGEPANLVDKLLDARGDHARGEMHLRPTLRLHAHIAVEILRRVPRLVRVSPRPAWVLTWGLGYLVPQGLSDSLFAEPRP